ncbi:MAG: LysM peptidoglycan-binding domain-containing protein [Pseudomonadota bacterium]
MQQILLLLIIFLLSSCASTDKIASNPQPVNKFSAPEFIEVKQSRTIAPLNETLIEIEAKQDPDEIELKPIAFDNLWNKIPHLYKIPEQPQVTKIKRRINVEKQWYLNHTDYLYRVSERAQPYLYLIIKQIEQRELPAELALLPIVESAYQPHAYSRGRAAGLWQFIPGTGKYFGLKQNWWYDGRRDIYAATNAALDYLEKLNKQFDNDWLLALAAYNSGAGTVNKAIKRNKRLGKGTTYWDLKLPRETQAYVPKLLAIAQVIKELKTNKIKLLAIKNQAYLDLVDCENHIDLAVAAELAGITIEELYKYNPGFNQWATDPDGPHHLLLPIDAINTFKKNLDITDKNNLVRWSSYKIQQGDSLSRIAKKYSISIAALKKANRLKNSRIRAGKYLVIPMASKGFVYYNPQVTKRRDKIIARINAKKRIKYRVKHGDSLWTISRKYNISYKKLANINGISPLATLSIGQKLTIWLEPSYKKPTQKKNYRTIAKKNRIIRYKVRKGDSLYTIAKRYKLTVKKLKKWNKNARNKYLKPGQRLVIYI